MGGLFSLVIDLVIVCVVLWLINAYIPKPFSTILNVVIVLAVCLSLLQLAGIGSYQPIPWHRHR